jgi:hypothetical protein
MVDRGGRAPPPSPGRADFTIMMECIRQKVSIATLCVLCGLNSLKLHINKTFRHFITSTVCSTVRMLGTLLSKYDNRSSRFIFTSFNLLQLCFFLLTNLKLIMSQLGTPVTQRNLNFPPLANYLAKFSHTTQHSFCTFCPLGKTDIAEP